MLYSAFFLKVSESSRREREESEAGTLQVFFPRGYITIIVVTPQGSPDDDSQLMAMADHEKESTKGV